VVLLFLLILGLAIWVFIAQGQSIAALQLRTNELSRKLNAASDELERIGAELAYRAAERAAPPAPREPGTVAAPLAAETPATAPPQAETPPAPQPVLEAAPEAITPPESEQPEPVAVPPPAPAVPAAGWRDPALSRAAPAAASSRADRANLAAWLAENGLAWIGGGALALGGAFLVAHAAQRGFFTPLMRLYAALALGAVLIAAGEVARRRAAHPLVAALLVGAGASTFYAAAWAAHGLYHYIAWGAAAVALSGVSALLLGLSFRHGQPMAALAVGAALLAPILTSRGVWPPAALTLFLAAVVALAFVVAMVRRWHWTAGVGAVGAYVWFALSIADDAPWRGVALLMMAGAGAGANALLSARRTGERGDATTLNGPRLASTAALAVSCIGALLMWLWRGAGGDQSAMAPGVAGLGLVAMAGLAVRVGAAEPAVAPIATATLALGFVSHWLARTNAIASETFYAFALAAAGASALAGLTSLRDATSRACIAGAGAIGALALVLVRSASRADALGRSALLVWAPLAVAGVALAALGFVAARSARDPYEDVATDIWMAAAAAAGVIAIEAAAPLLLQPALHASLAVVLGALFVWRGWRATAWLAALAGAAALARGLSGQLFGAAYAMEIAPSAAIAALAPAGALVMAASLLLRRRTPQSNAADTLSTLALLIALAAAFIAAHAIVSGGARAPLDPFLRAALDAALLSAAGLAALPRRSAAVGVIARYRGHMLLGLGLLAALIGPAIRTNPWWGAEPAQIAGPALFNPLALALGLQGALALAAGGRIYGGVRAAGRAYGATGAFLVLVWATLEIRRGFHAPALYLGEIGLAEGALFGLLALGAGMAVAIAARVRAAAAQAKKPLSQDLSRVAGVAIMIALAAGALILLLARNPWWGWHEAASTRDAETLLAVRAHLAAALASLVMARAANDRQGGARLCATSAAVIFAVSFGNLLIRWLAHRGAMDDARGFAGLEGFAHALWPLGFCCLAIAATSALVQRAHWRAVGEDLASVWPAALSLSLAFACVLLWIVLAPWWGLAPASATGAPAAALIAAAYVGAFALTLWSGALLRNSVFAICAKLAAVMHMFVLATLAVRRAFRGDDMTTPRADASLETWTFSAVWALFGAAVLGLGLMRRDATLRWAGLAFLLVTTAKVFLMDMARLDGVVRAGSFLALGGVLIAVALASRRFSRADEASASNVR
jgi:uncharacterized membrane protein